MAERASPNEPGLYRVCGLPRSLAASLIMHLSNSANIHAQEIKNPYLTNVSPGALAEICCPRPVIRKFRGQGDKLSVRRGNKTSRAEEVAPGKKMI